MPLAALKISNHPKNSSAKVMLTAGMDSSAEEVRSKFVVAPTRSQSKTNPNPSQQNPNPRNLNRQQQNKYRVMVVPIQNPHSLNPNQSLLRQILAARWRA